MISHVKAAEATIQLWSPDDISEDIPDLTVADDQIGVLVGSTDGKDGTLLVGTAEQVISGLEGVVALIREEHARIYGVNL